MSFHVVLSCDAEGCAARVEVEDRDNLMWDGENFTNRSADDLRRGHFWIEQGWTYLPNGWAFGDPGVLCPQHRPDGGLP